MFFALILFVGVPIYAFVRYHRKARAGLLSKGAAIGRFAFVALLPTIAYLGLFFAMVGLEEVSGAALIPEEMGRGLFLWLGFGLAAWLAGLTTFAATTALSRRAKELPGRES